MGRITLTITASSARPKPPLAGSPPLTPSGTATHPRVKYLRHQCPHQPGDTVFDNDILRVVQQIVERHKLRAHERAQHPKERRDLARASTLTRV